VKAAQRQGETLFIFINIFFILSFFFLVFFFLSLSKAKEKKPLEVAFFVSFGA
jgi:hypothetical protein